MKMNDWGHRSVPSLLAPNELKHHQVIKEEVRHFVAPGSQRPIYGRNNSLPNMKRGESRWQSSESTRAETRILDSPPAFRGVHSPSSVRKQLLSAGSTSNDTKSKKKRVNHKKGDKLTASSAHEHTTTTFHSSDSKIGSPRHGKRIRDFQVKSAHESRTRNGLLDDDDDDFDGNDGFFSRNGIPGKEEMKSFDRVRFSSLFEGDSFTGSFPLGGMGGSGNDDDVLGLISAPSLDPLHMQSEGAGAFGASPITHSKQPRKSAMRKPAQGGSTASSLSSLSLIAQDHADESSPSVAKVILDDEALTTSVPDTKRMDDRWEPDVPTESKSSPSTSPKVPGRAKSDGSVSLAAGLLPLSDNNESLSLTNLTMQETMTSVEEDGQGSTKQLEGSLSKKLSEEEVVIPLSGSPNESEVNDTAQVPLHEKVRKDGPPTPHANTSSDSGMFGDLALKDDKATVSIVYKQSRRRGSTGVLAQKWEEQFPHKTPILPQSAPTTPRDSARKRFNHRRRGSFGIYANVSNDDDEPLPPKVPRAPRANDDDDYDLFLQSGATGDFATWLEEQRKEKGVSASKSPSIHRKSLLPPTQRRGSTGALAQRWEQELLPALQASSITRTPPMTPTGIPSRRSSGSVREKLRQFGSLTNSQSDKSPGINSGDARVLEDVSPSRRDSKRRGSMAALVEKWEKLTTPAGSPKDNVATATDAALSGIVDQCNNIPFDEDKSERCESSGLDIPSESQVFEMALVADDPPILVPCEKPAKATKQKRRGSTGALANRSKKEPKEGQITKTSSGKSRMRRISMGHVDDKPTEKKKKTHREKSSSNNPTKKKPSAEPRIVDDVSMSAPPSREQVAGEGSMEKGSHKSPKSSPKLITKHYPESKGASDHGKSRKESKSTPTKGKGAKNDMDLSKNSSSGSHSSRTLLTVPSDLDTSKRSTSTSQSKKTRSSNVTTDSKTATTSTTDGTTRTITSTNSTGSTKVKKRSNSVGAMKVKSKKSHSDSRSRSATRVISAADAQTIKQKKHLPGKLRGVEAEVVVTAA